MTAVLSVSATSAPDSGSLPRPRSMTMAFLPSPLSWMSATSDTTDSFPAAGSGPCSRMDCDPCKSMAQLNFPIRAPAPNAGQQITAKVGSTCWVMSWLLSVVNDKSSVPAPTPRAYSIVSRSVHSNSIGSVTAPTALGSMAIRVSSRSEKSRIFCTQPLQTLPIHTVDRAGYRHAHTQHDLEGGRRACRYGNRRCLRWLSAGAQHHLDLHPKRTIPGRCGRGHRDRTTRSRPHLRGQGAGP